MFGRKKLPELKYPDNFLTKGREGSAQALFEGPDYAVNQGQRYVVFGFVEGKTLRIGWTTAAGGGVLVSSFKKHPSCTDLAVLDIKQPFNEHGWPPTVAGWTRKNADSQWEEMK